MKVSDYIAKFLSDYGLRHAFVLTGGASVHLIDSIQKQHGIEFISPLHEQSCAMAADGYSRATGCIAVAISTSGPGATNLLTGVCCAYYDSVPLILITGQVSTFRMTGETEVRQIGFQETRTVDIYRPVTKYSVLIKEATQICYELQKAFHIAQTGRPGPVLIDIPDDIQREDIDPEILDQYSPNEERINSISLTDDVGRCLRLISKAERPVIIFGWGVHLAHAEEKAINFATRLGYPVALTWAACDLLPFDNPLLIGTFGTHGTRYGNFAVQNADLIISVGSRLDTKATGSPITTFAREAKKIVVDIDPKELAKFRHFGLSIELPIQADAGAFLDEALLNMDEQSIPDVSGWISKIVAWKQRYPICHAGHAQERDVNPYVFVKELSRQAAADAIIVVDTGCTLAWMMQAFEFKAGQRLFHDFNNTAMGWALPAAIGAAFAFPNRPIICVTGDGSLQMNIQELATVIHHELPIKIFLINNSGYSMIRQTQDQWLGSNYLASSAEGGLALPNFMKLAEAYGFRTSITDKNDELCQSIRMVLNIDGSAFCCINVSSRHRVIPQVTAGRPNEDLEPLLERHEFIENMIVEPDGASVDA